METQLKIDNTVMTPMARVIAMQNRPLWTDNLVLDADSYKYGHWLFLEDNTQFSTSYIEARVGAKFDETVFFGLQYIIMKYFLSQITKEMVGNAEILMKAHGLPFNRAGWDRIVDVHDGYLPVKISAVPEGTVVPVGNAMVRVDSTDKQFNTAWVASFIETKLMRAWYPMTVATQSREIKKVIKRALQRTSDDNGADADMKLVDFGSRGVSGKEQSEIGGAAHLVNFKTTDNIPGIALLMDYYTNGTIEELPGFSIPATEHSVTTSWGKKREFFFYNNIVRNVLPETGICSVVIDTYDTFGAIKMFAQLRKEIEKNGTIVFRPDSGDPVEMTERVLLALDEYFGSTVNEKGYKVLNPCARIIQGDGVDLESVREILDNFERLGFSADNIVFGSGGALLQKVNRDTQRLAMKASNVMVDMVERDIQKVPATDMTKASKKGKLRLVRNADGKFRTITEKDKAEDGEVDVLEPVYKDGELLRWQHIDEVRELAAV